MKKNLLVIGIVALATAFYFFSKSKKPEISTTTAVTARQTKPTGTKLIDQVRDFPGLPTAKLSAQEKSSECKSALESIETLPLTTLLQDLKDGRIKLKGECLFSGKSTISSLNDFPEACEARQPDGQVTTDCAAKVLFYKALRIHHATINENSKGLSTEILINKLIGLLADQAFASPTGLKLMRDVGRELRERLPQSDSAAKAELIGYLADDNLPPEGKQYYETKLDEARQQFPENWEIYEMDLIRKKSMNEKLYDDEIKKYYSQNPNSGIATYHMGCSAWNHADKVRALEFFDVAKKIAPQDKRFADTYSKASTLSPPEKVCTVQINFNPEQF